MTNGACEECGTTAELHTFETSRKERQLCDDCRSMACEFCGKVDAAVHTNEAYDWKVCPECDTNSGERRTRY